MVGLSGADQRLFGLDEVDRERHRPRDRLPRHEPGHARRRAPDTFPREGAPVRRGVDPVRGRLGNFIEGGVVGAQTTVPWGFIYPDLEGARHPVALYESAKNAILVPILIWAIHRRNNFV